MLHGIKMKIPITLTITLILVQNTLSRNIIVPGTKWCGKGNIAKDYDDLGISYMTDSCCRAHDHCKESISAGESKYGLQNDASTTRSHCDCDLSFYNCLSEIGSRFSKIIRFQYFRKLHMKCFRLDYPIVECSRKSGKRSSEQCEEYIVDKSQKPIWQWFDNALSERRSL